MLPAHINSRFNSKSAARVIASLIETIKLNDIEPHAYLATTITKIVNGHPNSRLDELLPWASQIANALKDVA